MELHHRAWIAEAVLKHTLYRQETWWPRYYYRGDFPKLNDAEWQMSKLPVHTSSSEWENSWEMI